MNRQGRRASPTGPPRLAPAAVTSPRIPLAAAVVSVVALAVPALVVADPPALPRVDGGAHVAARALARRPRRVVPPAELPAVEPVELVTLTPDDARAYNETVPFVAGPKPPARPFRFAGTADEQARATDCLAAALIYEAGDDAPGMRAVAQVVLNRLRHPAFPKTVCGVVFQGQERSTGCQFTFTCDGALGRAPSEVGWRRAREIAAAALNGAVYRPVGLATHYHTDWVVPYWQSSLDKLARVHTHLFFRWSGWWGTPPAFDRRPAGPEPVIARIAFLSDAHRTGAALAEADAATADGLAAALLTDGAPPQPLADQDSTFLQLLPAGLAAEQWPAYAKRVCGERAYCKLLAWADARPAALPLTPAQQARMGFSYLRDRANGFEKALWNCDRTPRADRNQCMKAQVYQPPVPVFRPSLDGPTTPAGPRGPAALDGVRRRGDPAPLPASRPLAADGIGRPAADGAGPPAADALRRPGTSPAPRP